MQRLVILASCLLVACGTTRAIDLERLPNGRLMVMSDMHGICSTRYVDSMRQTTHLHDTVTFRIEYSSQSANGEVRGFMGNLAPEDIEGFSKVPIESEEGDWILYTGRDQGKDVFVRDAVGGTAVTIMIDRDSGGVREEVLNLLGALISCRTTAVGH